MTSIYQRALGADFERLHPQIQRRFGFASGDGVAAIGTGVMDEIWRGGPHTLPFLYVGTWRRIMFPERAQRVPFRIENYAYVDALGRETVTWLRTFHTSRVRRFDAYMIYSQRTSTWPWTSRCKRAGAAGCGCARASSASTRARLPFVFPCSSRA